MEFFEFALVYVLTLLAGGWAIPAGILFELDPILVYVASVAGSLTWLLLGLTLGARGREWAAAKLAERGIGGGDGGTSAATERAAGIVQRWGVAGLALGGSLILGPTITILSALVLGVDRTRFAVFYAIGTLVGFAVATAFWAAVL